ncbi:MAG: hypothetical protein JXR95_09005 [Deltaproteobacteria bacterium]|nr:hypothetical protein [Deltaproteobacteria bacterium]
MKKKYLISLVLVISVFYSCDDSKGAKSCGDGFIDIGEECDSDDTGNTTCGSLGFYEGSLKCSDTCTIIDTECKGYCGDDVIQLMYAEHCDGSNMNGETCRSQGYHDGVLKCTDSCTFDTSLCTGIGNQKPVFNSTPPLNAEENHQYLYSVTCTDPEGDELTIEKGESDTCGGELTAAGGNATYIFTPDESQGGTNCTVHLKCSDGELMEQQLQLVAIQEENQPPSISNLPEEINAPWAVVTNFDVHYTDPDIPDNAITWEITNSTCSFDSNINTYGRVSFTCDSEDESCEITIRATDNGTVALSDTQILSVNCMNLPPVISSTPAGAVDELQNYSYPIECDDSDGQELILSRGSDTCGGTFTYISSGEASYEFTPAEHQGGEECSVVFYCTDGFETDTQSVTFTINETNSDPVWDNLPSAVSVNWGESGTVFLSGHDTDVPVQSVSYGFLSTDCSFGFTVDPISGEVEYTCAEPQVCEAEFSVMDSLGGTTSEILTVNCENTAPYFVTSIPSFGRNVEENSFPVQCRDLQQNAREITVGPADSCGGTINDSGNGFATYSYTTSEGDTSCTVDILCSDEYLETSQSGTVSLSDPFLGVTQIVVGGNFSCSLASGKIYCWGYNNIGQLGNGTTTDNFSPTEIAGSFSDWEKISAGWTHACGIRNGQVYCWGNNSNGQLGTANLNPSDIPVSVDSLTDVTDVSCGGSHTCAISGGHMYCWGNNSTGQLGDNTTSSYRNYPTEVYYHFSDWEKIRAGSSHTCGIRGGRLYCWGYNNYGQLGNGTTSDRNYTVEITSYSDWTDISAGISHTCGIRGGHAYCWGNNSNGQLGVNSTVNYTSPREVYGSHSDWTFIENGDAHTCGIRGGHLYCWGRNNYGQLGDGSTSDRYSPAEVTGSHSDWIMASGGFYPSTCGIRGGHAYCWGNNTYGQLGTGDKVSSILPVLLFERKKRFEFYHEYGSKKCATRSGKAYCWSGTDLPAPLNSERTDWVKISIGSSKSCGLADGKIYCWDDPTVVPTQLSPEFSDWEEISSGNDSYCAVRQGRRYCWGTNNYGQLGIGNSVTKNVPTEYDSTDTGWTTLSSGNSYHCGLKNGQLYCWGYNSSGQLGDGTYTSRNVPVENTLGGNDWVKVSATNELNSHTCALKGSSLYCWGYNVFGQLGDGTITMSNLPVNVDTLYNDWTDIFTLTSGSCAIRNGRMYCWGRNDSGQLGDTTLINRYTPVEVQGNYSDWKSRYDNTGIRADSYWTIGQTLTELDY